LGQGDFVLFKDGTGNLSLRTKFRIVTSALSVSWPLWKSGQPCLTRQAIYERELHQICGVDLTKIPGIKEESAQNIISEVRLAIQAFNSMML
jgi:hypothetical protein